MYTNVTINMYHKKQFGMSFTAETNDDFHCSVDYICLSCIHVPCLCTSTVDTNLINTGIVIGFSLMRVEPCESFPCSKHKKLFELRRVW